MRDRLARTAGILLAALALLLAGCDDTDADSHAGAASESTIASTDNQTASAPSKGEAVGIAAIDAFIAEQDIDRSSSEWKTNLPKPPQADFGDGELYWVMDTNVGNIKIRLMPDEAPMHVSSTVYLTRLGFYDDVIFHRVITGFMAQGGDPLGKGFGGPGYKYDGEFGGSARHNKGGMLSMANAGPGTDGSQFFITFVPTPHLDGKHTIFGEVVEGQDTVEALQAAGSRNGRPSERLVIEKATIVTE